MVDAPTRYIECTRVFLLFGPDADLDPLRLRYMGPGVQDSHVTPSSTGDPPPFPNSIQSLP